MYFAPSSPAIDATFTTRPQPRSSMLGANSRAQRNVVVALTEKHAVPLLQRDPAKRAGRRGARVVDQDVDRAQVVARRVAEALHAPLVGRVARDREGVPAPLANVGGGLLDLGGGPRGENDAGAGLSQDAADRRADAAASPRDDGAASVERSGRHAARPGVKAPCTASARIAPSVSTVARPSSAVASAGHPK